MNPVTHPVWIFICGVFILCIGMTILMSVIGLAVDLIFGTMRIVPLPARRPRRQVLE